MGGFRAHPQGEPFGSAKSGQTQASDVQMTPGSVDSGLAAPGATSGGVWAFVGLGGGDRWGLIRERHGSSRPGSHNRCPVVRCVLSDACCSARPMSRA